MEFKITKQCLGCFKKLEECECIRLNNIIGELYLFDGMCEWSKQSDPVPPYCGHHDCIKAFWINHTKNIIRSNFLEVYEKGNKKSRS